MIKSHLLYRLSYGRISHFRDVITIHGIRENASWISDFFLNIFVPAPGKSKNTRFSPPFSTTETGKTPLTDLPGSGTDKEPLNLLENNGIGCKVTPDCL